MNRKTGLLPVLLFLWVSVSYAGGKADFSLVVSGTPSEPAVLACRVPEFSFHIPYMAGNLRLGVLTPDAAGWGSELKNVQVEQHREGQLIYTIQDSSVLGKGTLIIRVAALSDTRGIILKIEGMDLPDAASLFWAFGGCLGKVLEDKKEGSLKPEYCTYNIFSIEGGTFTAYYGESMALKVFRGITPMESDIRLSDAHAQKNIREFYDSGKITDAPALAATIPLVSGEKIYLCFQGPGRKADYTYFMLPELFKKEYK
ncbi:MAG: DUF4450 domain-containing protein [Bacteroides sp.]|nr:DUF4450 domain-containing protein [Bacteroides sp.]